MSEQITYSEYWNEIRNIGEEVRREAMERMAYNGTTFEEILEAEDWELFDAFYEVLWETLDGHSWVIYTANNFDVLRHSPNDGAHLDAYGQDGMVIDGNINWAAIAFAAMEADVNEWMNNNDINLEDYRSIFDDIQTAVNKLI